MRLILLQEFRLKLRVYHDLRVVNLELLDGWERELGSRTTSHRTRTGLKLALLLWTLVPESKRPIARQFPLIPVFICLSSLLADLVQSRIWDSRGPTSRPPNFGRVIAHTSFSALLFFTDEVEVFQKVPIVMSALLVSDLRCMHRSPGMLILKWVHNKVQVILGISSELQFILVPIRFLKQKPIFLVYFGAIDQLGLSFQAL